MHLKAEHISKRFDHTLAVEETSFEARAGYILGILGPQKSGKTTVLRMLINILQPDSGQVSFDDQPINQKTRDRIGYLTQDHGLYENYSLQEVLVYLARLKSLPRKKANVEAVRLIDRFNLIDNMESPVGRLDKEQKEKLSVMAAIIHNPDVIIFDEPLEGYHPQNIRLIRKLLQRFREEGKTIIIASENLNEAEALCDEVVLLNKGKVVLQDNLSRIYEKFQENLIVVEANDNLQSLKKLQGVKKVVIEKQVARLFVDNRIPPQKILEVIIKSMNISRMEVNRPRLNDIFLEIAHSVKQRKS